MQERIEGIQVMLSQNPALLVIGVLLVLGFVYYKFFYDSKKSVGIDIDPHERTSLPVKSSNYYQQQLDEDGIVIDQEVHHGKKDVGTACAYTTVDVPNYDLTTEEPKDYEKDEDDEEEQDEVTEMYVFRIRNGGMFGKVGSQIMDTINGSGTYLRAVRKDYVEDQYDGIHIDGDVKFIRYGGMMVEDTTQGLNVPNRVSVTKALEKNVNNIDEYVKRENHWSDQYSKDMGRYEKEAELEERRFGGRMNNR